MRCYYKGVCKDGAGKIIDSATVSVYLYGTTTAASIYTTLAGATAVNSVTSSTDGTFEFWVSRFDYDREQCFDIKIAKTGFTTTTWSNVDVSSVVLGTYTISADTTVSTNLGYIPKGVLYSVASGKTLTISGTFDCGLYKIFAGSGTVAITGINTSRPEWFGTNTTPGTTDMTTALQNAITALSSGGVVKLSTTTYAFTNLAITTANTTIEGDGWGSVLSTTMAADVDTAPAIWVKASGVTLKNFKATWATLPTTEQYGQSIEKNEVVAVGWLTVTGGQPVITKTVIDGVYVYGGKQHGISVGWSNDTTIKNCRVEEVYGTGIFPYETTNIKITDNFVYRTKDAGIDLQSSNATYADNAVISHNIVHSTSIAIGSHGGRNVTISDNVIDNTWGGAIYCQPSTYYGVGEPTLTSITGNVIRRPFQFYGAGNFHTLDRYATVSGALAHIEVLSTSDVIIANNIIDDDSDLHTHYMMYVNGRKVTITGNTITSDGAFGMYLGKQGTPDGYTDITSLTVTGNNISISSGNGSVFLTLLGVATGVISGNYFDCGGQTLSSPLGRFLVGEYAKDVLVTGNRIVNYTDLYTNNGNSSNIVLNNNIGAYDIPTSLPVDNADKNMITGGDGPLTIAVILKGIIEGTPTGARSYELPTGTLCDANGYFALYQWFDWSIINLASATHAITLTVGVDHTIVGSGTVAAANSGLFRTQKTAANTFITYRIG